MAKLLTKSYEDAKNAGPEGLELTEIDYKILQIPRSSVYNEEDAFIYSGELEGEKMTEEEIENFELKLNKKEKPQSILKKSSRDIKESKIYSNEEKESVAVLRRIEAQVESKYGSIQVSDSESESESSSSSGGSRSSSSRSTRSRSSRHRYKGKRSRSRSARRIKSKPILTYFFSR